MRARFATLIPAVTGRRACLAHPQAAYYAMGANNTPRTNGVAVYCGSSLGNEVAYRNAAICETLPFKA